jgi:hypothetical protein
MTMFQSVLKGGARFLDAVARHSLGLARLRSLLYFLRSERKQPLLVYQMGKVGSTTLVASLRANRAASQRFSIYQVHRLTARGLETVERNAAAARARLRGTSHPKRRFHPENARLGKWLRRRIADPRNLRKWDVITLVRDPISRNLSSFFQNLAFYYSYDFRARIEATDMETVVSEVCAIFEENCLDRRVDAIDTNPMTWFDRELKEVFDVDVYASDFPVETGYRTYESERARVLLIRLEDLNRVHAAALQEFLGIDDLTIVKASAGDAAEFPMVYEAFLRSLSLPSWYVDEIYASRYTRHFYTEEEIRAFRNRWKTRETSNPGEGKPASIA